MFFLSQFHFLLQTAPIIGLSTAAFTFPHNLSPCPKTKVQSSTHLGCS